MKTYLRMILTILVIYVPAHAIEQASEQRLDEVAKRGEHVMPFDLELTTHIFTKSEKGGIQQVVAKDKNNTKQISLIREHLIEISNHFRDANFSAPAKIHGDSMPGLSTLRNAKNGQINIIYKEVNAGAEITYSTDSPVLINAIHQWFDAQLVDHARHAVTGHSHHHMHHQ